MYNLVDTIGRLKNAIVRSKLEVKVKESKFIISVLDCLLKEGYIRGYYKENIGHGSSYHLVVMLKYKDNKSVIHKLKMISVPSRKVYVSFKQLRESYFKGENYVVSSSKGVFLNKECSYKLEGQGGVVLFEIN